ncbi:MAG: hypothetical protein JXR94_16205, partial [Candidatus Hydrogenedentes bacterium]|nr:hypothetical protein [Candidatus Hydrogenedentota bacterium]
MTDDSPNIPSQGDNPTEFGIPRDARAAPAGPIRMDSEGQNATEEVAPELIREQRAVALQPGDVVADRFEVVRQLGFGGMGAV